MTIGIAVRTVILILAIGCAACSEGFGEGPGEGPGDNPGPDGGKPWLVQFTFGNSSINSANVTTNQDGISPTYLADYVLETALPASSLEYFTTHAYFPTEASVVTRVSAIRVEVSQESGSGSGNIYDMGEFVQQSTIAGQLYSVYRLTGHHAGAPISRAQFANVVFEFDLNYEDGQGSVLNTSRRTIEIYKR